MLAAATRAAPLLRVALPGGTAPGRPAGPPARPHAHVQTGNYQETPLLVSEVVAPSFEPDFSPGASARPREERRIIGAAGVSTSWMEVFQAVTRTHQHFDIVFTDGKNTGERFLWTPDYGLVRDKAVTYTMRVTAGHVVQMGFGDTHDATHDGFREALTVPFLGTDATVNIWITPRQAYVDQFVGDATPAERCGGVHKAPCLSCFVLLICVHPAGRLLLPPAAASFLLHACAHPPLSPPLAHLRPRTAAVALAIVGGIACVFIIFDVLTRGHTSALSLMMASGRLEAKTEREIYQRQSVFARMIAHEARADTRTDWPGRRTSGPVPCGRVMCK